MAKIRLAPNIRTQKREALWHVGALAHGPRYGLAAPPASRARQLIVLGIAAAVIVGAILAGCAELRGNTDPRDFFAHKERWSGGGAP